MSTHALWWPHQSATKRPRDLRVDDEPHALDGLRDTLWRSFEVHASEHPIKALDILRQDPAGFAVVISDLPMPRMSGADFRLSSPHGGDWRPLAISNGDGPDGAVEDARLAFDVVVAQLDDLVPGPERPVAVAFLRGAVEMRGEGVL